MSYKIIIIRCQNNYVAKESKDKVMRIEGAGTIFYVKHLCVHVIRTIFDNIYLLFFTSLY